MSPIGRVIIVLNFLAAGLFVGFAGTNLQRQHQYKELYTKEQEAHKKTADEASKMKADLEKDRQQFEIAKAKAETELGAKGVDLQQAQDEVKRQQVQINGLDTSVKELTSNYQAQGVELQKAFAQAKAAYDMAIADQKTRDEAVSAKNAAEAENRTLKTEIASLQDTVKGKDLSLADLTKEKNRLNLLVSVATQKGFLPGMAAPKLAGMVTNASANLCTIQVTDNPGKIDIADEISRNPFRIAIYDASGYKGEAVATSYEASANAIFCRLELVKGDIKEGDKAATATN